MTAGILFACEDSRRHELLDTRPCADIREVLQCYSARRRAKQVKSKKQEKAQELVLRRKKKKVELKTDAETYDQYRFRRSGGGKEGGCSLAL